jgi:hypothetical protein
LFPKRTTEAVAKLSPWYIMKISHVFTVMSWWYKAISAPNVCAYIRFVDAVVKIPRKLLDIHVSCKVISRKLTTADCKPPSEKTKKSGLLLWCYSSDPMIH